LPVGEVFYVVSVGAREHTRGCSPRAPRWFGQNRLGCCFGGRACFQFETEFCLTTASLCSRGDFLGVGMRQNLLIPASVRAVGRVRRLVQDKPWRRCAPRMEIVRFGRVRAY